MNEREWLRIAGEALQSLKRIEKTVSEPQTLSAHRIAANAKIERALTFINKEADVLHRMAKELDDSEGLKLPLNLLQKIGEILTDRET